MSNLSTSVLVVAECPDEVEHLTRTYGKEMLRNPQTSVLAFGLTLQAHLEKQGIHYFDTCKFCDAGSHKELASLSAELLAVIRDDLELRDEFGVSSGYSKALVFFTRFYLNDLLFLAHVFDRVCAQVRPGRVLVAEPRSPVRRRPDVTPGERYLAKVVRALCNERGIPCEVSPIPGRRWSLWGDDLQRAAVTVVASVLFRIADARLARRRRGRTLVMATTKAYNLGCVVDELRPLLGPRCLPVYLQSNDLPALLRQWLWKSEEWSFPARYVWPRRATVRCDFEAALDRQLARLRQRLDRTAGFRYRGLDLTRLVDERARAVMRPYLLELHAQTAGLNTLLDKHRPDLILSQFSVGWAANLGTLAARKGIPAVLIPHGSMVPATDPYALLEWQEHGLGLTHTDYPYLAVQTPWTQRFLEQSPVSSVAVPTGPLLFARPGQHERRGRAPGSSRTERIVLHVGTPKSRGSTRFWVYETVDEYVSNINSLIRSVEEAGGYRLLIRVRYSDELTQDDFATLLAPSDCYEICSDGSLSDYLGHADLLVSYSSTAIEEALQLNVPVLQYDPQGKYCHVKGVALDPAMEPEVGSCYFVSTEDHLTWALRWLLVNHLSIPPSDALWDEHRFETAGGLLALLETIGVVTPGARQTEAQPK